MTHKEHLECQISAIEGMGNALAEFVTCAAEYLAAPLKCQLTERTAEPLERLADVKEKMDSVEQMQADLAKLPDEVKPYAAPLTSIFGVLRQSLSQECSRLTRDLESEEKGESD